MFEKTHFKEDIAYPVIIGLSVIASHYWVITHQNGFLMDDFYWIWVVKFTSVGDIFTILPRQVYNDRPVGALFIKILFSLFELKQIYFHLTLLLLHVFNSLIVFVIVKKLFQTFWKTQHHTTALLSAIIFGMWPNSTMAVQWVAAVFDLLGATFYLLAINLFIDIHDNRKNCHKAFHSILCMVFYYLALRTKEMAIVLPLIFIIYEICLHMKPWSGIRYTFFMSFRPSIFSLTTCMVMVFYFGWIMKLKFEAPDVTADIYSPYYYSFHPLIMGESFLRYISMYFNFLNPNFTFIGYNLTSVIIISLFFCILAYAAVSFYKKRPVLLSLILCTGISLAPVLPMANMQHRLYLYIPSAFISVLMAVIINQTIVPQITGRFRPFLLSSLLILCIYLSTFTPGVSALRNYWADLCMKDRNSIQDILSMPRPQENSLIYVKNASSGYHIFFYGPGFINCILFDAKDLKTFLNPEDIINKEGSYYVMEYNNQNGHVTYGGEKSYQELISSLKSAEPVPKDTNS